MLPSERPTFIISGGAKANGGQAEADRARPGRDVLHRPTDLSEDENTAVIRGAANWLRM
jgi:hypothetical protein